MSERQTTAVDVSTARLEAFSDGVIAIIITIMVLDLKAPSQATAAALLAEWPTFLSYALSFLLIAIYWVNHRHVVRYTRRVSPGLLWANMLVLFTLSLIPLATAWLGDHLTSPVPNVVYGLVLICGALSFLLLAEIVYRQNKGHPELAFAIHRERIKAVITLIAYAVITILSAFLPGAILAGSGLAAVMYFTPTPADARPRPHRDS
jgi:uncharacterized membrane protein